MKKYLLFFGGVIEEDDTTKWYEIASNYIVDSLDKMDENSYLLLDGDMLQFYLDNKDKNLSYQEIISMTIPSDYVYKRNLEIENTRKHKYTYESDPLYMSYVKYIALGQDEKASKAYNQWIAKVKEIEEANPYIE